MASSLIRFSDSFIQSVVWIILIIVRVIEIRQIGKDFAPAGTSNAKLPNGR